MNLQEWKDYIGKLAGQPLWSKTIAANTQTFIDSLRAEGMSMDDIYQIILTFMRQIVATGGILPGGGAYDLRGMAEIDTICMKGVVFDDQTIEFMMANPPPDNLEPDWF